MIIAPYRRDRDYDEILERKIIPGIQYTIEQKHQDFLLINVGATGTGKTSLGLHIYECYAGDLASIDYVSLNQQDLAVGIKLASAQPRRRFSMFDEANVSKRDASSRFNKDLIGVYFAIRGLEIFSEWNNPSLDYIDKPFIEEKLNAVIVVIDKSAPPKPRRYLFFTREGILRLLAEHGDLKLETIRRHGRKYALYMGWFKQYRGRLWKDYEKKKQARMEHKVDDFYEKYGKAKPVSLAEAARRLRCAENTIRKYAPLAIKEGALRADCKSAGGHWRFEESDLKILQGYISDEKEAEK